MPPDWDAEVSVAVHAAFGGPVSYQPKGGTPFTMPDAIFEDGYQTTMLTNDGPKPGMTAPYLKVRQASFPAGVTPKQDDRVTVPLTGDTYIVKQPRPDKVMGDWKLVLQKTSTP